MDDQDRPKDPTEGVRIIGAEEAAEAIERGDVAPRRGDDEPRFGDRPPPPPAGPRPALRFPLDASADPTRIERPPVQPPPDPVTGPVELPHWTEPPTGEVPRVLITGDQPLLAEDADDLDAWSSFASSTPRWRDADDDWVEDPDFVEALRDEEEPLGALQDDDRLSHEEYHSFDDLEERVEERRDWRAAEPDSWSATEPAPWAEAVDEHAGVAGPAEPAAEGDGWDDEWADDAHADPAWADQPAAAGAPDAWGAHAEAHEGEWADDGAWADDDDGYAYDDGHEVGAVATRHRTRRVAHADLAYDQEPAGGRDMTTSLVVGLILGVIAAVALYVAPAFFLVILVAALGLAGVEFFNALRRVGYDAAILVGIVACIGFPLAVYARGVVAFPLVGFLVVAATLCWYLVGAGGPEPRVVEGVSATILGVAWIGGLGSIVALMLAAPDGRAVVLTGILATVGYDVGGLYAGRALGHRPLSAASPNKTVEGLAGGMIAAVVITLVAVGGFKIGPWHSLGAALLLGIGAAVAAPLGDLCQSLVKRDLGIKDMGAVLPGHGGVFDRIDGMLFVMPMVFWLVVALGHWGF